MKVGILTFHRAENFGAVLQAYGLQQFLCNNGCEVEIIDYRNKVMESMYHIYNPYILITRKNIFKTLAQYIARFKYIEERKICKMKYEDFREQFLLVTNNCYKNLDDAAKRFDCIIAGSDQIWNLHLTGGLDTNYFLGYNKTVNVRKVSYAASSENDPKNLFARHRHRLNDLLDDFDFISVREEFLKDELQNYTSNKIEVCLDPTFLLCANDYKQLTKRQITEKYVLVYHMTPIPEAVTMAEQLANKAGWEIIEIHMGYGFNKSDRRHKTNLGPLEILSYIVHAESVFTSSFHGLALSIIFKKDVWVIDKGNNLRQRYLLHSLKLDNRLLATSQDFKEEKIDYNAVTEILNMQIEKSKNFILNAVHENE